MEWASGNVDFAELPCGKWEWNSVEELRADWDALMLYVEDYDILAHFITKAWGAWESEDSDDCEWGYEIIWDSNDGKRDQDDFTNRMCGFCGEEFDLGDPHYYDEEESECYCSEVCFRKEKEESDDDSDGEMDDITPKGLCLRRKWVEDYNNSLPQRKWFDTEFEVDMSIGIVGIYDSEYMNFIYNNIQSKRIEELLKKE